MKKKLIFTIIFLISSSTTIFALNDWERAVSIYKNNIKLQPHKVIFTTEIYNDKGDSEKTILQIFNIIYNGKENPETNLIQAMEDGKDETKKYRKQLEKSPDKDKGPGASDNYKGVTEHPLDYRVQNQIEKNKRLNTENKDGKTCSVWDFSFKMNEKFTGIGTAYIDTKSGAPIYFDYTIKPDSMVVKNFRMQLIFDSEGKDNWVTKQITMTGDFTLLLIKKKFISTSKMYTWQPEELDKPFFSID